MYAEFVIKPNGKLIFERLPDLFGQHNRDALARSRVLGRMKNPDSARYYACEERPAYRLCAWWATTGTVQVFVEPTATLDVRRTCQEVWDGLRSGASDLKPQLTSLTFMDENASSSLAAGRTGVVPSARRVEAMWAFGAGIASAAWLGVAAILFGPSGDLVLGAVPSIVIAMAAGAHAVLDSRSGTLHWS
jgi:hypothetical protein